MIFVSIMAIAFAMSRSSEHSLTGVAELERTPSAMMRPELKTKEQILGAFTQDHAFGRHTEKAHGPIDVKLELEGSAPANTGDTFVLRGVIHTDRDIRNVHFKWSIPSGVKIVNGAQTGDISQLLVGSPVAVELTLQKISGRNEQIHLHAEVNEPRARFADVAQFNTDIQEMLDSNDRDTKTMALKGGIQTGSKQKAPTVRIVQ
jgi:hypothetical protein